MEEEKLLHPDEAEDQKQIEENLEPVQENLESHEESDKSKWDDVYEKLNSLASRIDDFEKWVNEAIGGIDKASANEAEDASEGNVYDEDEISAMDKEFYDRQAEYLRDGGY